MSWYKQLKHNVLVAKLYAMAHGLDIEKQYWERYQIMQKKSCQHQHYGIGRTGSIKYMKMKKAKTEQASTDIYQLF